MRRGRWEAFSHGACLEMATRTCLSIYLSYSQPADTALTAGLQKEGTQVELRDRKRGGVSRNEVPFA